MTDEDSPFNECAHADLAGVRTLLDHMTSMPEAEQPARRLQTTIQAALAREGADLVLCGFSDEPFNTADIIAPDWWLMPRHLPTSLTLLGILVLAAASVALGWRGL